MIQHRRQSSITAIGKCWEYGSKVYFDPVWGKYLQFALIMRGHKAGASHKNYLYVHWFHGSWIPKKGEWLECKGESGGTRIQERLDTNPIANLVLMCWNNSVKRLDDSTP